MSRGNIDKSLSYKKKGKRAGVGGGGLATTDELCYINEIPIELITHIVSLLDPKELSTAAQVCKHWRWIITDDSCWKSAFIQFFGCLPYRRLASDSWKNEYIIRTKLLRKWEIGRGVALSFDPRVGVIHNLYVESVNSWMLAGSLEKGMVSRSDPNTGKISKDIIFSTQEHVSHSISAMLIDRYRILWGYKSGAVGLTTLNKQGLNRFFKQFLDFHAGPVSVFAWSNQLTNTVVSGGEDGLVNLWDINSGRCIESLHTDESHGIEKRITTLAWNVKNYIIAGTANGTVHIWSLDSTIISSSDNSQRIENIPHDKIVGKSGVISLHYVESSNALIVAYEGISEIKQFDLKTLKCICVFEDGHLGNVTCTVIDIQENKGSSNDGGIKPLNILASGDSMGVVCLWKIDGDKDGIHKPFRVFEGRLSPITAIHFDAFKIITGSLDGSVIAFDPLTSKEIRILYQRSRRTTNRTVQAQDGTLAVTCIYSKDYRTVATIGGQIKTWDFSSGIVKGNKAKTSKKKNTSVSTPKYMKLKDDVRESAQIFELEKQEYEEHLAKMQEYTPISGLTNEEMLAYALMISKEENQTEDDQIAEALRRSLEIQEKHER
ncbi:8421_t:CDS:10 [Funneliformis geosporum]|uniref:8421_t:CDS:1 n=1 Tax=Funneliformis geosporum TaxID=1117311 RepID=A0A9W4SIK1_9GLOM|nr:8421_t:CDS:10 [Funneliformis geosporum]